MKNKIIDDITEFKSRLKKLYEYKIHDLNLNQEEAVYRVHEDEVGQTQPNPKPVQPTPPPQSVPPKPIQPTPPVQPIQSNPIPDKRDEEMNMMSYLKSELQKLDNVVNTLEMISSGVDELSNRLDKLTYSVDEIKEPSDIEKLEMRAFDSYPYNKTLTKVWDDKMKSKEEQEMERMGIQKTQNGFEMEYQPQRNFNQTQSSNNFNF